MKVIRQTPWSLYEKIMEKFTVKKNEPMKEHTSFKVGGNADLFALPGSVRELKQLILEAAKYQIPVMFIGGGTNILVTDKGIRGIVICLSGMKNTIKIVEYGQNDVIVAASAGTMLCTLGKFAVEKGFKGLNFTAGIPGTVGGAVMMNSSSAHGKISDVISSIKILNGKGEIGIFEKQDIIFSRKGLTLDLSEGMSSGYSNYAARDSSQTTSPEFVILEAFFKFEKGDKEKLSAQWYDFLRKRNASQPVSLPSAGCFFKNPESGTPAGKLIDMAGLKGERCGNAMISEDHANFIVNLGGASAGDILTLKKRVEEKVFKAFSVQLEPEVRIEGE